MSHLVGAGGIFLLIGMQLVVILGAVERRGQRRRDCDEQYCSYSHQNVWCQQPPQGTSFVCNSVLD